jgi:hypothetical protein|mmetsp:Transcript_27124/g.25949  ORF Transcript_27124/g.25949 Transcript_27124/m.25949 type:complete len:212 (+) Transcript_27124:175-810(+)
MGLIFNLFTSIAGYSALLLCSLSLTAGLYMLAEFAEEYPTFTGKIIKILSIVVIFMYLILYMDGLPLKESIIGILCQVAYMSMLLKFPFVEIFSMQSFASVIAVLASHYFWLSYFLNLGEYRDDHSFQIVGFFVIMIWATPIGLLISLTINDNVIPYSTKSLENRKHATIFMAVFDSCAQAVNSMSSGVTTAFKATQSIGDLSILGSKKSY